MNTKEKLLTSNMLRLASNKFSNFGCNDLDEDIWTGWCINERQDLVKEFCEYNGDVENYDPDFLHLSDWLLMEFLAHKLETETTNSSK